MNTPGENNIWTPSRLRTQLAAQKGLAPAPSCYIVWRATTRPNAPDSGGYELPGDPGRHDEATFERWLIERNLAGPERLSVSVLVIREQLDDAGLLRDCVLERRRGGAEGPSYGNVARVEFTGPAKHVRRYRASREGRLTLLPAEDDTGVAPPPVEGDAETFAGEDAAVRDFLGDGTVIVDRRTPTLFEDLVGLSAIVHALPPEGGSVTGGSVRGASIRGSGVRGSIGGEIACGVGWHGGTAFVLVAGFPRDGAPLLPPPDLESAVVEAANARDLVPLETRLDNRGFRVIARERDRPALVSIRLEGKNARITPYAPGRIAAANEDQRRWMTYAETYEARTVLDSWQTGEADEIAVVTVDQDQEAWRHVIDGDGIEVSRRPDNTAAAAVLWREQATPPDAAPLSAEAPGRGVVPHPTDWIDAAADESVPTDSLLTKVLAWSRLTALLRSAIAEARAVAGNGRTVPRTVPRAVLDQLSGVTPYLAILNASFSAGSLNRLLVQCRSGAIEAEGFVTAVEDLVVRLRDELALTRNVTLPNSTGPLDGEPPFGPLVELHFPAATYDIEEAARCLMLRRPTAAVLHAMKVMRHGLDQAARLLSTSQLNDIPWSRVLAAVRATPGHQGDLIEALTRVRRAWRGLGLLPADKYTEEEAAAVLDAVAGFMRALAARVDAVGDALDD